MAWLSFAARYVSGENFQLAKKQAAQSARHLFSLAFIRSAGALARLRFEFGEIVLLSLAQAGSADEDVRGPKNGSVNNQTGGTNSPILRVKLDIDIRFWFG